MKLYLKTLLVGLLFSFVSCQSEDLVEGLSPNQEQAMLWTDWGAGLATAELGPVSFFVAGAASTAYYLDHVPPQLRYSSYLNTDTDSSYADEFQRLGVDHNSVCKRYILDGARYFDFNNFQEAAMQVRPDLYEEIIHITPEYLEGVFKSVNDVNFSDPRSVVTFVKNHIALNGGDEQRLFDRVSQLLSAPDPHVEQMRIAALIDEIDLYSITDSEKTKLVRAFSILKYSSTLWKH